MEHGLKELLENEVLSEETRAAFLEAWNSKLTEMKASLREEVEGQDSGRVLPPLRPG
jgi:hypothetical protein